MSVCLCTNAKLAQTKAQSNTQQQPNEVRKNEQEYMENPFSMGTNSVFIIVVEIQKYADWKIFALSNLLIFHPLHSIPLINGYWSGTWWGIFLLGTIKDLVIFCFVCVRVQNSF